MSLFPMGKGKAMYVEMARLNESSPLLFMKTDV